MLLHPIPPVYDRHSRVLILGSFPSVRSREEGFFYGHPQNRFWKVLTAVFSAPVPVSVPEKKAFLLSHGIALWDVIARCEITGSSDASVRNAEPTDLSVILQNASIRRVYCNGTLAYDLYRRYQLPVTGLEAVKLPSTSPANAAWTESRLREAWQVITEDALS